MGAQRLPPDKGDSGGDSTSAPFQPQIPSKNLQNSIPTHPIQPPQANPSVLSSDCGQNLRLSRAAPHCNVRPIRSGRGLAPTGSLRSTTIGSGGLPWRHVGEYLQGGASQSSIRISPTAQSFFPSKASRGCSKISQRCGILDGSSNGSSSPPSYRDALLLGTTTDTSVVSQATLVAAAPKWNQHRGCRSHEKPRVRVPVLPLAQQLATSTSADADEGWQVVGSRQRRARSHVPSPPSKLASPRYLAAVAGRCLNCLSFSHRVATCHLPTRCFNCHVFRHHLRDCKRPRNPSVQQASGGSVVSKTHISCDDSSKSSKQGGQSQDHCCTKTANIGSRSPKQLWVHIKDRGYSRPKVLEVSVMELQLGREPLGASELRSWDPMIDEAANAERFSSHKAEMCCCQEKVHAMVEELSKEPLEVNTGSGSSTTPSLASSPQVVNHQLSEEDIQSPVMPRSEGEQLIGHELIEALSSFKQSIKASSSPSTRQVTSLEKEAIMINPKGNQSRSPQRKIRLKTRKPDLKVI